MELARQFPYKITYQNVADFFGLSKSTFWHTTCDDRLTRGMDVNQVSLDGLGSSVTTKLMHGVSLLMHVLRHVTQRATRTAETF